MQKHFKRRSITDCVVHRRRSQATEKPSSLLNSLTLFETLFAVKNLFQVKFLSQNSFVYLRPESPRFISGILSVSSLCFQPSNSRSSQRKFSGDENSRAFCEIISRARQILRTSARSSRKELLEKSLPKRTHQILKTSKAFGKSNSSFVRRPVVQSEVSRIRFLNSNGKVLRHFASSILTAQKFRLM